MLGETPYRFVIHDRDCIFSTDLDQELAQGLGVKVQGHRGCVERNTICTDEQKKLQVISRPVLGGLHREYAWENRAAQSTCPSLDIGTDDPGEMTVTWYLHQT